MPWPKTATNAMRRADAEAADAVASEWLRAQARAFCILATNERGVTRLMYGHDASTFGEPGQVHPARMLWKQWLDAIRACEEEGMHWPDGTEETATVLWSALFGRFALWTSTFGEHDPRKLTDFADRVVDATLRDARR